ncbi:MAG TPA: hypothetical protein VLG50_08310 [Candidatus Saccharimonadales bacterium]|nr:hypothetical protein [Candidatus Saccharimonadales bacterium]
MSKNVLNCCLKPTELNPEQLEKIGSFLKPGSFCSYGFMSLNDNLMDIYHKDMQTLDARGITIKQIVDVLTTITEKYKRKQALISGASINDSTDYQTGIEKYHYDELRQINRSILHLKCNNGYDNSMNVHCQNPIIIDKRYLVTRIKYWGFQPCPFIVFSDTINREDTGGGDDYWIYDLETGKTLQFNDLLIHLIGNHHFFEGNVYHRLDPNAIIDFFNLQPGVDYYSKFITVDRWIRLIEGGDISPCYVYGTDNKVSINQPDKDTVIIECTQLHYSQKSPGYISPEKLKADENQIKEQFAAEKHEYVFCEVLVDGLPIRHRLDLKKVSTYKRCKVNYIPIMEEKLFTPKEYTYNLIFTTYQKSSYIKSTIINGEREIEHISKNLLDHLSLQIL